MNRACPQKPQLQNVFWLLLYLFFFVRLSWEIGNPRLQWVQHASEIYQVHNNPANHANWLKMLIAKRILKELCKNKSLGKLFFKLSICTCLLMLICQRWELPAYMNKYKYFTVIPDMDLSSQQTMKECDPMGTSKPHNEVVILVWTSMFGCGSKYATLCWYDIL